MTAKHPLGELEQLAMLSVLRLGREAYAARVRRDLDEIAARPLAAATVHVTLVRLERKGYVESEVTAPEPVRGGRSRRCFRVTPAGAAALRESRTALDRMWARVKRHPDLRSS
jgi:PadR family transcriptional regulator PadR